MLALIAWLVHWQIGWLESRRPSPFSLETARRHFPGATAIRLTDPVRGLNTVFNAAREQLGTLLATSPETDDIVGYSGPNNLLVALNPDGAVKAVELLRSGDTPEHVEKVLRDPDFLHSFIGWRPSEDAPPKVEGVAGATLTSFAMAESLQRRLAGAASSLRFPEPVTVAEVAVLITNTVRIEADGRRLRALDLQGRPIGYAVRTSPEADNVAGYRGPTELLVALSPDGRTVTALKIRRSYDTASYIDRILEDESYLNSFVGRTVDALATLDFRAEKIEGVSGATETSFAIAEGLKRRFQNNDTTSAKPAAAEMRRRDWALMGVIAGSLIMAFTSLRGHRWMRLTWQTVLIGYVGLASGDLLSLALFGSWATHGITLQAAPGLVFLAAAAFFVPWASRRQLYCHQLCPHGAAQQWMGALGHRLLKLRRAGGAAAKAPAAQWTRWLERLPVLLLAVALVALVFGVPLRLSALEPFDAWVWRAAGWTSIAIALAGLGAAFFVPQAYCRFGCPTGALLRFVRSSGSADRWGSRDWAALGFLGLALAGIGATRQREDRIPTAEPVAFHGPTMGTTWTVKLRGTVPDHAALKRVIADTFEAAEKLTSHWRTNTPVALFNWSTSTNAVAVTPELIQLIRWSEEISRQSDGAFDITVGPLVRVWGFGPAPHRTQPPSEAEINAIADRIGWRKIQTEAAGLRKLHPQTELDLSAIVPGWAIDRVAAALRERGFRDFLIESGGELRASGSWPIAIEHPRRPHLLRDQSIGTSGSYRQTWRSGDRDYSHLLDPRTLRPITHSTVSVSVLHADCAQADAWAAALNVLGVEKGLPLVEKLGLAAQFVVSESGKRSRVVQSSAWPVR